MKKGREAGHESGPASRFARVRRGGRRFDTQARRWYNIWRICNRNDPGEVAQWQSKGLISPRSAVQICPSSPT